jgi:hypothetical protein
MANKRPSRSKPVTMEWAATCDFSAWDRPPSSVPTNDQWGDFSANMLI